MRIINLNPDRDIGASAWYLEMDGFHLLMDAGIHPKREGRASLPMLSQVGNQEIDAIAVSHCHHDHVGALPVAVRHFPNAHVLLTELSYFLVERVLHNSVNVMNRQREELGIRDYPLYSHDEVDNIAPQFQGFKYNREIEWAAWHKLKPGVISPTLEFHDAGHALGSAGIMVRGKDESLFYSGDVCFHDQTVLKAARFEDVQADVLILETTRGNRAMPPGFSRQAEIDRLAVSIDRVLQRGGSVLVPVFALGRTQEILAMLALEMKAGKLRRQPVYIGGLGRVFTEIYDLEAHRTHRHLQNLRLTEALNLQVLEKKQFDSMRQSGGRLFVLTAGMMSENTPAHELAARLAAEERHAVFFVGYADPDTPGGRFKASKTGEPFFFSTQVGELTRLCEMDSFDLTAHAQREDLLEFVGHVSPQTVILSHGDDSSRAWFEEQIHVKYPRMEVIQAMPGQPLDITPK